MLNTPSRVTGVSHPLIREMYLKKDFTTGNYSEDVLVIETALEDENGHKDFDLYLAELLNDLKDVQIQAEQKIGPFDRIDIRTH